MPNKLIHATSPYLLQHAHNPVNWQEWSPSALDEAKKYDKPILVSIGYAACHWCHVMEKQSFENNDIAAIMNEHFVCIKVDREERPDLDQVYMEAVQAMGINGGWPLNVFLTPDQKPFFGGTYFPPQQWARLLHQVAQTFKDKRDEINQSAGDLAEHLQRSDLQRFATATSEVEFSSEKLHTQFPILQQQFDAVWGGLAKAPKFVMPSLWLWLLRYHTITKNTDALDMVMLTVRQMTRGGLYDQLGGGFARYSVDGEWFAPHFEKMLYDNAQLLSLLAEVYAVTKDEYVKHRAYETTDWLACEMTHANGGLYSAIDADSEGAEGKFYTWTYDELVEVLGKDSVLIPFYQATKEGNWEHGLNILWQTDSLDQFLKDHQLSEKDWIGLVSTGKKKLMAYREKRPKPLVDDKVITGWNAMAVQGLTDCYKIFSDNLFLDRALKIISFIERHLVADGKVYRTFKNKHSVTEGFLEDYAFLIQAYVSLYEVTFDENFIQKAKQWTDYVLLHFYDRTEKYFHFSSSASEKLIARKKEIFDNVIPSSNSVMARNLFRLGTLLDRDEWKEMATEMTARLAPLITSEPVYMAHWAILYAELCIGLNEVVISGTEAEKIRKEMQSFYSPFSVYCGASTKSELPLLENREPTDGQTKIYVCRNKVCKLPVTNVTDALKQIHF